MRISKLQKSKIGDDKVIPASAAPFLIVLTLIFVFYVILLQPADRAELLGESGGDIILPGSEGDGRVNLNDDTNVRSGTLSLEEFVFEGPGKISRQSRDQYDHDLTSFNFKGEFNGEQLVSENDFYLRSSLFSSVVKTTTFNIDDVNAIRDAILTFSAPLRKGILSVSLNGSGI